MYICRTPQFPLENGIGVSDVDEWRIFSRGEPNCVVDDHEIIERCESKCVPRNPNHAHRTSRAM